MIRRMALIIGLSLIASLADADGALIPLKPDQQASPEGTTILREGHTLTLYQRPDAGPLRLSIRARQIGSYDTPVVAHWPADADRPRGSLELAPGESGELVLEDCKPGPVEVRLDAGKNAASVACNGPMSIPAAMDGRAHFISRVGTLYFFVPEGTERFTTFVRGQGNAENAKLTVFAPDGTEAGSATSMGSQGAELRVDVPAEHAGAVWSLTADKADEGVFEECYIGLGREVPQHLSLRPDALLVPFVTGLRQPPRYVGSEAGPTVRFALTRPVENGTLTATWLPEERGVEPPAPVTADVSAGAIEVQPHPGFNTLRLQLQSPEFPLLRATTTLARRDAMLYIGGYQSVLTLEPIAGPGREGTGLRISSTVPDLPPLMLTAALDMRSPSTALRDPRVHGRGERILNVARWRGEPVEVRPDEPVSDGAWVWWVRAKHRDGSVVDFARGDFVVWNDTCFADRTPPPPRHLPADAEGPWIAFAPAGADAVPFRYHPSDADVARRIEIIATPGEYEPTTLGIRAGDFARNIRVEPPVLTSASGETIPADAWDVRWARYWPQRTSWRSTAFEIIPEMLERRAAVTLYHFEPAQAWLTVRVPDEARPGRYSGHVTISDASGYTVEKRIVLEVLPFKLLHPADHHWGLYTDSPRWRNMSEGRVRAELRDFVDHGITSAMMYPPYHAEFSMEHGDVRVDSQQFETYMRWALEEGLRPPTVISMQALGGKVKRLVPDAEVRGPEFERVYRQIVQHFADIGEREGWGKLFWHAVDEPNRKHEERIQAAYEELSWFKDLGLSTFTTVNDPLVAEERLDPVLDARCYYAAFVGRSAAEQQLRSSETADSGDHLWLYGTGCYTGMDGTTMPNRYLAGYMLRKTEAEGIWCWTLQRAKGDVHNDFDGEGHRESKEACTTYPPMHGSEMVPTLQWEGHREGVDDFRYIYTLEQLAAERGERGQEALAELDELLAGVPWGLRPGDFSAADADEVRREVAGLIQDLLEE